LESTRRVDERQTIMPAKASRRRFMKGLVAAGAAVSSASVEAQGTNRVSGFDHVAVPMQNTETMVAFYRRLGFQMTENENAVSVYVGSQMINFHRPAHWQDRSFTLRAPAAKPPSGDFCFVWNGTAPALKAWLDGAGVKIELGPVDRAGGRRKTGSSTYVRDPDGNLLEFIIYG
jgi:catechol 2,3-dioxygenase-like lactoylglutathione lyase family enzyme